MSVAEKQPITRADIETKLREIRGEVDTAARAAKPAGVAVGAVVVVAVVAVAYFLGRRRGKHSRAIVEVRRV